MNLDHIRSTWANIANDETIDEGARKYAVGMHSKSYDHYREKAAAIGVSGDRMLDAGCGTGTWSFAFADLFSRVDGCDISEDRIEVARRLAAQFETDNLHFSIGDVLSLPYENEVFDFVYCYSVAISYIPITEMLREFARVLKPEGKLFVGLNGHGWNYYLRDRRSEDDDKYRVIGCRGIYNTLVKSNLSLTADFVRDCLSRVMKDPAFAKVKKVDHLPVTPQEFIERFGSGEIEALSEKIKTECGEEYFVTFVDDIIRIGTGSRNTFSYAKGGRGYEPNEIALELQNAGYSQFRWDQEERLFAREGNSYTRGNLFNNLLTTWEFIATKNRS